MVGGIQWAHQAFAVQEGRAPVSLRGPAGEVNDVVQVPGEIADVLLLLLQRALVALRHLLGSEGGGGGGGGMGVRGARDGLAVETQPRLMDRAPLTVNTETRPV